MCTISLRLTQQQIDEKYIWRNEETFTTKVLMKELNSKVKKKKKKSREIKRE